MYLNNPRRGPEVEEVERKRWTETIQLLIAVFLS